MLQPCKKNYKGVTGHRAVLPAETLRRLEGVGVLKEITSLDKLDIPVFLCESKGKIYKGKGGTKEEAMASALMEAVERYSASLEAHLDMRVFIGRYDEFPNAINPEELILPDFSAERRITWVEGFDIVREESVLVPANAVFFPFRREIFKPNTNGLAAGNTLEEAVCQGLAEVIERDAWSLVEASKQTGATITDVRNEHLRTLLEKYERAGIRVTIKEITTDVGVPTFAAVADDPSKDPRLLLFGLGAHVNAEVALGRALTELAQARATQIYMSMNGGFTEVEEADMRFKLRLGYEGLKRLNAHWYSETEEKSFDDIESLDNDDILEDIDVMVKRLRKARLKRVIVVDLTSELGVPVVRVIVPGLEAFAFDDERFGDRCAAVAKPLWLG
ncbi:MAG TPA: YcaO-related McrA-glycine thioamidation protein [Methanomicrobia archaeon]|nr:YcaO-related McrA-glycine thioamidation protein [Methanomicrobia archaeon]HEX59217.1 YcaO-related McrA-glycine thioamidation protein [Methanomicrobia archaeon]